MDLHKLEAWFSVTIFSWVGFSQLLNNIYPIVSFIAVTCGAILGLHGVYNLIFKRNHHHKQNYYGEN